MQDRAVVAELHRLLVVPGGQGKAILRQVDVGQLVVIGRALRVETDRLLEVLAGLLSSGSYRVEWGYNGNPPDIVWWCMDRPSVLGWPEGDL